MEVQVTRIGLQEIKHFRILFLHENHFQFTYDKCHYYGWADTYVFSLDEKKIGYGAVWGKDKREDRDAIMEFFVLSPFRPYADLIFKRFIEVSGARYIECQSNDPLLTEIVNVTPGRRQSPKKINLLFQFLHHQSSKPMPPEFFLHLHVNVCVGDIII